MTNNTLSRPKLSVCMITYNHEKYIAKAIEGVLNQNIELELVIVDDASSDTTSNIIQNFIEIHPKGKSINFIRNAVNKGMINNFIFALQQCQYELVALCEGDDYWEDPNKLVIQKKLLYEHPNIVGVFHDVKIITPKGLRDSFHKYVSKRSYENGVEVSIESVIEHKWIIPTCSVVFRRSAMIFPEIFHKMKHGDFPLFCFLTLSGPFMFLEKSMAVYRMNNSQSIINSMKPLETITIHTNYIEFLQWLNVFSNFKYDTSIRARILEETRGIDELVKSFQNGQVFKFYQSFVLPLRKIRNSFF